MGAISTVEEEAGEEESLPSWAPSAVEGFDASASVVAGVEEETAVLLSTADSDAVSAAVVSLESSLPRNRKITSAMTARIAMMATATTQPASVNLFSPFECRAM